MTANSINVRRYIAINYSNNVETTTNKIGESEREENAHFVHDK